MYLSGFRVPTAAFLSRGLPGTLFIKHTSWVVYVTIYTFSVHFLPPCCRLPMCLLPHSFQKVSSTVFSPDYKWTPVWQFWYPFESGNSSKVKLISASLSFIQHYLSPFLPSHSSSSHFPLPTPAHCHLHFIPNLRPTLPLVNTPAMVPPLCYHSSVPESHPVTYSSLSFPSNITPFELSRHSTFPPSLSHSLSLPSLSHPLSLHSPCLPRRAFLSPHACSASQSLPRRPGEAVQWSGSGRRRRHLGGAPCRLAFRCPSLSHASVITFLLDAHIRTQTPIYLPSSVALFVFVFTNIHTYIHSYIHTSLYTHVRTCIDTRTHACYIAMCTDEYS